MKIARRVRAARAAMVVSAIGLAWAAGLAFRAATRPAPESAIPLAEEGRFDEAEAIVRAHLRGHPGHPAASLLLAQLLLKRPPPSGGDGTAVAVRQAQEAMERLDRIPDPPSRMRPQFALWRGKALFRLGRLDAAEAAYAEAMRLDPATPEAGWGLLEIHYLEGRAEDARRLALRLQELEPDPRDRVQILLELVRQDAQPPAPGSLVQWFEPVVRRNPQELGPTLALGLAQVHTGALDPGLDRLRRAAEDHPDTAHAWEAWLTGLDDAGQIDDLAQALDRLPPAMAVEPRFARYRGRVAQERLDWQTAVREYRRGRAAAPPDPKLDYRLARALRQIGATAEAEPLERGHQAYQAALDEVRPLYREANTIKTLGVEPHPDLYRRLADLRRRMGLADEARAWYRLALSERPDDPVSRAALQRLDRPASHTSDPSPGIRPAAGPRGETAAQHGR